VDGDFFRNDLGGLSLGGRFPHLADDGDAGPCAKLLDFAFVVGQGGLRNHLDVAETGAVVDLQEAEAARGVPASPQPAVQLNLPANRFFLTCLSDGYLFHDDVVSPECAQRLRQHTNPKRQRGSIGKSVGGASLTLWVSVGVAQPHSTPAGS